MEVRHTLAVFFQIVTKSFLTAVIPIKKILPSIVIYLPEIFLEKKTFFSETIYGFWILDFENVSLNFTKKLIH